jgi:hypothetical protein
MERIMKRAILLVIMALCLSGCSMAGTLAKIPEAEFARFEYHRAGNATSTHITATNAIKVGDMVEIEKVTVSIDYGPFANFLILLEGYKK